MRTFHNKTILIIENEDVHQTYLNRYFDETTGVSLIIKEDVHSAIDYLETMQQERLSLPGLLLVSYKSLVKDSQTLFSELKKRNLRAYIPVIALSDTDEKNVIEEAYGKYSIASYLVKPEKPTEWQSLFDILVRYWFNEVTLPNYSIARHG
jgi:CheY-like chemotaxis protein